MRKVRIVLEAQLAEPLPPLGAEGLAELFADARRALMTALIDLGADDPSVSTDVEAPSLRVEVVAESGTEPEALSAGVRVIASAFAQAADAVDVLGVERVSAHTVDLATA